ncbi:MAG: hypothetical protein KKA60_08375 [Proteobacteria bacterium]|nr:hypothetical protein [Pseudomonadota bacterium]
MTTLFLLAVGLFLVLVQTVPPGLALPLASAYDLTAVFVLYLSLFRPPVQGAVLAAFLGSAMDLFAGGPPGPYLVAYLWIFAGARSVPRYVRAVNPLFLAGASVLAVGVEAAILSGASLLAPGGGATAARYAGFWGWAMIWAGATGWAMILGLSLAVERLEKRISARSDEDGEPPSKNRG